MRCTSPSLRPHYRASPRLRSRIFTAFHGLRREPPGSALSRCLTTAAGFASATDRSVALPCRAFAAGLRPSRFQIGPPAWYRAPWRLPGTDSHRQATTSFRSGHDRWTTTSVISGRTSWSTRLRRVGRGLSIVDDLGGDGIQGVYGPVDEILRLAAGGRFPALLPVAADAELKHGPGLLLPASGLEGSSLQPGPQFRPRTSGRRWPGRATDLARRPAVTPRRRGAGSSACPVDGTPGTCGQPRHSCAGSGNQAMSLPPPAYNDPGTSPGRR
jgi:hypothetical protein